MGAEFLTAREGHYKERKKNKMNLVVLDLNERHQDELIVVNM